VYAIGAYLRLFFDRYSEKVIYEELPYPEKLFEICEGIFIAQLQGDLVSEKRLYDLLILIYRSPELMIKMTGSNLKYKKQFNTPDNSSKGKGSSNGDGSGAQSSA